VSPLEKRPSVLRLGAVVKRIANRAGNRARRMAVLAAKTTVGGRKMMRERKKLPPGLVVAVAETVTLCRRLGSLAADGGGQNGVFHVRPAGGGK